MNTPDGKGSLYYKFNNYKRRFEDKPEKKKKAQLTKEPLSIGVDESDHIRSLKYDNLTIDQKFIHWRGCVATRINHIRTHGSDKKFFADWTQFKLPTGNDFVSLFYILHFLLRFIYFKF